MKIAVIGAGRIGGNLTRRLTRLGHDVTVADSRGPETLADLAAETGARATAAAQAPLGARRALAEATPERLPEFAVGLRPCGHDEP